MKMGNFPTIDQMLDWIENGVPGVNNCTPPYGSEWERNFEWVLSKNLADHMVLENQVREGKFRLDYQIRDSRDGRRWIFEFDGKAYHDDRKDHARDLCLLMSSSVQGVCRIDAKTGELFPDDCRTLIHYIFSDCFNFGFRKPDEWVDSWHIGSTCETISFKSKRLHPSEDHDVWMRDDKQEHESFYRDDAPVESLEVKFRWRVGNRPKFKL